MRIWNGCAGKKNRQPHRFLVIAVGHSQVFIRYYERNSTAHVSSSFVLASAGNIFPSFRSAPGQEDINSLFVFPMPLPPEVANGIIVFPEDLIFGKMQQPQTLPKHDLIPGNLQHRFVEHFHRSFQIKRILSSRHLVRRMHCKLRQTNVYTAQGYLRI